MLAALIPAVTELASGYLSNRKEKAVAKQKLAVAKIEAQVTKVQSDASWEEKAIDSCVNSLKDESWTLFHPAHRRSDGSRPPAVHQGRLPCPEGRLPRMAVVGNFGLDSSLVRPQEHRAVQEMMEWWELWLVTMVTLNTAVNYGRWIADRKRR